MRREARASVRRCSQDTHTHARAPTRACKHTHDCRLTHTRTHSCPCIEHTKGNQGTEAYSSVLRGTQGYSGSTQMWNVPKYIAPRLPEEGLRIHRAHANAVPVQMWRE